MTLEKILTENNINPSTDLIIDKSIQFASMASAFISGIGDYVTLFEPTASELEKQGYGYIVGSLGSFGKEVPYTVFSAKKSFIENNQKIIKNFEDSIQEGLNYVNQHTSKEIAEIIIEDFPDTNINDLITTIDNYKKINAWQKNTKISENQLIYVQEIMENSGELKERVPFKDIVYDTTIDK